jgi:starch synthase
MARLRQVAQQQGDRDFLVVVALDGENAWEFFPRDGHDFLNALYTELSKAQDVVTCTVGQFLETHPPQRDLEHLHTGSWVGANLDTWVGDPEHNVAWDLLAQTRDWLAAESGALAPEPLETAWREVMITEGSDWYWWFSRKHDSGMDAIWDNQFRLHLRNVYKVAGARAPSALFEPIVAQPALLDPRLPALPISPSDPDDPAWERAGRYNVSSGFGALHRPVGVVESLLYGVDDHHLYVRVDMSPDTRELAGGGTSLWLYCSGSPLPPEVEAPVRLPLDPAGVDELGFEPGFAIALSSGESGAEAVVNRVAEPGDRAREVVRLPQPGHRMLAVPLEVIEKQRGEPIQLALTVARGGRPLEQVPPVGSIGLRPPEPATAEGKADRLSVLIASSEIAPLAKSGGLADVPPALAKELRRLGHDVRLVMPRHRSAGVADQVGAQIAVERLDVLLGSEAITCSILEGRLDEVPIYLVECPQLYDRDSLYGYGDDDARFIYFSRVLIEMLEPLDFVPDVVHLNDWHTALVPNLLERVYASDPKLAAIATVLTIHNVRFQGSFGSGALHLAGLQQWGLMRVGIPHLDDVFNVLGRGIYYADVFNTVSERYAQEIQTEGYGEGLEELIRAHSHKIFGILNGIDVEVFDPATDAAIPARYSVDDLDGKAADKEALRHAMRLAPGPAPVVAMVARLYEQKGMDLVAQALPAIADAGLQFVILGAGDRTYEDELLGLARHRPDRVAASIGFDAALAQLLYAGADLFLMPSRSEPCGLGQLISLRYGTIPIVRATGGLADTVRDYDPSTDTGYGFVFEPYDAWQMFAAVVRAAETYRHRDLWERLVRRAMAQDVSWARSARAYVQLYRTAIAAHRERHASAVGAAG